MPGVAKTLLARTLAHVAGGEFSRIQFTPDLMPSDVVGTSIFDMQSHTFHVRKGPLFGNVILADEINRAPAKTQSALLEAMQEGQVSIDGETHVLPRPFLVLATQNPVEHEGTYPLPEAALDRFFFKIQVGYPSETEELAILDRHVDGLHAAEEGLERVERVLDAETFDRLRRELAGVRIADEIKGYVVALVRATRSATETRLGASPRAAIVLMTGARALAAIRGRDYVTPDDIQELAHPALEHRILLDPAAELDGLEPRVLLDRILTRVEVPR